MNKQKFARELLKIAKELEARPKPTEDDYKKAIKTIGTYASNNASASASREVSEYLRRINGVFIMDKVYNTNKGIKQ